MKPRTPLVPLDPTVCDQLLEPMRPLILEAMRALVDESTPDLDAGNKWGLVYLLATHSIGDAVVQGMCVCIMAGKPIDAAVNDATVLLDELRSLLGEWDRRRFETIARLVEQQRDENVH